jgi:hypothetical protein
MVDQRLKPFVMCISSWSDEKLAFGIWVMDARIKESLLCAGVLGINSETCQGDAGGPLIQLSQL